LIGLCQKKAKSAKRQGQFEWSVFFSDNVTRKFIGREMHSKIKLKGARGQLTKNRVRVYKCGGLLVEPK
jgi:hypothetical protein